MNKIYLNWQDVETLLRRVTPTMKDHHFDTVVAITRGGIIPGGILAERLGIQKVLVASVDFYSDEDFDVPIFMQFPIDDLLNGQKVLIVDDLWYRGQEVMSVKERVLIAGGTPTTFVMHYKPAYSRYPDEAPDFYTDTTDDWVIYPWELERKGPNRA